MSETTAFIFIIGACAASMAVAIYIMWPVIEDVLGLFRRWMRRGGGDSGGDGDRTVYIIQDEPPRVEDFVNAFSAELIFGGEFDAYLEWLLFRKDGKGILGELEGKHLGGLEELSKIEEVQRLFENIQRQVSTMFYRHLLDTYDYITGIHYANKNLFGAHSIRSIPAPNPQRHADAGSVAEDVHEERGETDDQREDGDHGGN